MIEYIHPNELHKLQLEIAKPNREIIGRLPEAFNIEQNIKLGQINELSFTIPYEIEKNFILTRNPNVDKLKSRYLVRASFKDQKEWFIISNLNNTFNEDGKEFLNVKLYSLGYQLKDKKIRTWVGVYINGEFRKESLNAQQVLEDLLSETTWGIDYIDSEFLTKYRSFDFNNTTVLDAVFEVARTFGAIIQWNTENRTISLWKQENIGINKGFRLSYGKYVKSLSKEERSDEMITRLRVYGKDGLSIQRVNPLGTDYIEDFSYFMQGFQRDKNKNTISSSEYMSDELCHALLDYQEFVAEKDGKFQSLLSQKETLESQKTTKENELSTLEMELKQIQDTIDVKQTQGLDASAELQQEQGKLNQIATKKAEIVNLENQINNIDMQIEQLKNSLSIESHFTPEQIIELNDYIIEETWEDQNYYDDVELYNDAKKVFEDLKKPKTIIDIDIVNLFKLIEAKNDWDKVQIGDKLYIHYEKFGIDVESQIIEMNINHDDNSISVTIANTVDIERDEEKLSKILYDSISVKSTIDMSKYKWDQVNNVKTSIDEILEGKWNPATNGINAGVNNTVTIDRRGITITSSDDPNKFVRMTNGVIGFTNDGGNTFKLALDATGVYAEHLVGQIVITEHLYIENVSGKYRFDQYGMTIDGGSLTITNGLPESQINPASVSKWNSAEQNAKNYTDEQINQVNQVTEDLQNQIEEMSSDNKITLAEANALKISLAQLKKESTDLINIATALGINTEKTNYSNAINDLDAYLTANWIDKTNYPLDITKTDRDSIKTKFETAQNAKSVLINKITTVQSQDGKNAWSKFSGVGNTLPAGNVEFNFAGSTTKGGNAINTDNVGNQSAIAVQNATINFNNRNDRKSTPPANPTIATNETAVDHTINKDGSADISFEWSFDGTGDAYDIDGFIVYVYQSTSSSPYTFGTTPSNEQIYVVTPEKRAFILYGVPADRYYTFGIQAYRIVDQDINPNGILKSSIVKPTVSGENPYRPTSNIAFAGDIAGTVNGIAASTVSTAVTNFNNRNDRKAIVPANPIVATDGTAIDHTINTDGSADISFEWSFNGSGDAYDIDGFIIYVHQSTSSSPYTFGTNTSQEQVFYVTPEKRAFILYGVPADRYYTFGIQAYRIVDPDINPSGVLKSSIVKSTVSGENPYQPSSNVSFSGNVTGTINGTSASTVASNALNALQQGVSYNNVKIDTTNGLVATRSDDKVKAIFNATDGFKFQTKEGSVWIDKFYYDVNNSRLVLKGEMDASELKVNGKSVLTTDKLKINGGYIDKIKVEQLDASTAKITTAMIETLVVGKNVQMSENAKISWSQVSDKPYIPQTASDIGALPNNSPRLTYIDAYGIYTGTISANQITAGTISANMIRGGTLSGITINIDTDAKVGNNLYLGNYFDYGTAKRIYFNDRANISGGHGFVGADIRINADTLWLSTTEVVFGDSVGNRATVDFTGCTVKGLNVVAKFG